MQALLLYLLTTIIVVCNALPSDLHVRSNANQQQRTKAAQNCRNQLNLLRGARQFCINYINANRGTTTLTTTVTPQTTVASTTVQTVTNTYSTVITSTPVIVVTSTIQDTSTEHDTATITVNKRDLFSSFASKFPREIVEDACLLFIYGNLQSPAPTTSTGEQNGPL